MFIFITSFLTAAIGLYARNIIGTGYLFNAIHGRSAPKWKGVIYGCFRGLLTLIPASAYAILTKDYLDALFGLLGAFQGIVYYAVGLFGENKYTVAIAEWIDNFVYGLVLILCWRL